VRLIFGSLVLLLLLFSLGFVLSINMDVDSVFVNYGQPFFIAAGVIPFNTKPFQAYKNQYAKILYAVLTLNPIGQGGRDLYRPGSDPCEGGGWCESVQVINGIYGSVNGTGDGPRLVKTLREPLYHMHIEESRDFLLSLHDCRFYEARNKALMICARNMGSDGNDTLAVSTI
jgi:hypothetical protein